MEFTRREAVRVFGTSLLLPVAGCTFRDTASKTTIDELQIVNNGSRRYTINLLLVAEGEPVYWNSVTVEPVDDDEGRVGEESVRDLPTDSGEYVLYAWKADQDRSEWEEHDLSEFDSDCASVLVIIGSSTADAPDDLDIRVSTDCPDEER